MKYLLILVPLLLNAQSYMAKIEPFDTFSIDAQTSGKIIYLDKNDKMKIVNKTLIKQDDSLDKKTLKLYREQLKYLKEKLRISTNNYNKFKKIRGKSQNEKDNKYINLLDIKNSITSLEISIEKLKDTIEKKNIKVKNLYIKSFAVNKGDYVSQGTKLASAYDIQKAKLTIFVNKKDYQNLKNRTILIDGKKDKASFYKIDITTDDTYISSYKVELISKNRDFGKNVTVEFIDEK